MFNLAIFFCILEEMGLFPTPTRQQTALSNMIEHRLTVGRKDDFSLLWGGVCVLDHLQGSHSPDGRVQSDRAFVHGRVACACDLVGGGASQRPLKVGGQVVHAVGVGLTGQKRVCSQCVSRG